MYSERMKQRSKKRSITDTKSNLNASNTKDNNKELPKKHEELLRHLTDARDELKNYKANLEVFKPWMKKARKQLKEKEKNLTDFDKMDHSFESTTVFVSDVIDHQADLNMITNSAKNFVDYFQKYKRCSNEYRAVLPLEKRARIETISTLESDLSESIASITFKYRDLLTRVHALLSHELSGLNAKQAKCKEAVNAAGAWLKEAERRSNDILYESIATDVVALKDQIIRIEAIIYEFISKGGLIIDAKKVSNSLLRSLEGQLSPDKLADVKNPIMDIENKYNQLFKALNEKCRKFDFALLDLKSQQVEDESSSPTRTPKMSFIKPNTEEPETDNELKNSIDEENNEPKFERTFFNTTEDFPRNDMEEDISLSLGPETPICEENDAEGSPERSSLETEKNNLQEKEHSSFEDFNRDDSKEVIGTRLETSIIKPYFESSAVLTLMQAYKNISDDDFSDGTDVLDEADISATPDIPSSENGFAASGECSSTLFKGTQETEESFLDDGEKLPEETRAIQETRNNENEDAASQEYTYSLEAPRERPSLNDDLSESTDIVEVEITTSPEIQSSENIFAASSYECITLSDSTEDSEEGFFFLDDGKDLQEETIHIQEIRDSENEDAVSQEYISLVDPREPPSRNNDFSNSTNILDLEVEIITTPEIPSSENILAASNECINNLFEGTDGAEESFFDDEEDLQEETRAIQGTRETENEDASSQEYEYTSFETPIEILARNLEENKKQLEKESIIIPQISTSELEVVVYSLGNTASDAGNEFSVEEIGSKPEATPSEENVSFYSTTDDYSEGIDPRSEPETSANEKNIEPTTSEPTDDFLRGDLEEESTNAPEAVSTEQNNR